MRARVQARMWGQATVPEQIPLDPLKNGYHRDSDDGRIRLTTTNVSNHRGDSQMSVQEKLLNESKLMQLGKLTMHRLMPLRHTMRT